MYRGWASRIGAIVTELPGTPPALFVEGLGTYDALRPEAGLHVRERRLADQKVERLGVVHVHVAAWDGPDAPVAGVRPPANADVAVVRRYQHEPTPLVRDLRQGWRTGRLDRVLAGEFDLWER
jgi:ATP-dependent Clp protease ATP-binding subunit ClpC